MKIKQRTNHQMIGSMLKYILVLELYAAFKKICQLVQDLDRNLKVLFQRYFNYILYFKILLTLSFIFNSKNVNAIEKVNTNSGSKPNCIKEESDEIDTGTPPDMNEDEKSNEESLPVKTFLLNIFFYLF